MVPQSLDRRFFNTESVIGLNGCPGGTRLNAATAESGTRRAVQAKPAKNRGATESGAIAIADCAAASASAKRADSKAACACATLTR